MEDLIKRHKWIDKQKNYEWFELSTQSKKRIIRQLGFMGYPTDDLIRTNI